MATADLLSSSRFATMLPTAPQASAAWDPFVVHIVDPPPVFAGTFSDHVLTLQQTGAFRARQSVDGRSSEGWCRSGCIGVVPAHRRLTWETIGRAAPSRAVSLFIPDSFVARVAMQYWSVDAGRIEIGWHFLHSDPVAEAVLTSLAVETHLGSPSGRLYAESACEFLAHHVVRQYSSLSAAPRRVRGGLTGRRLAIVTEFIHDNLSNPITLHQLASISGLSPRHFERAFRQAVGAAPHEYLTARRVVAARQLLIHESHLSVAEVARRTGFSSSSHLATAFRRRTGFSPKAFQRAQLPRDRWQQASQEGKGPARD